VLISDSNGLSGATSLAMSGAVSGTITLQPAASTTPHIRTVPAAKDSTGTFLQLSDAAELLTVGWLSSSISVSQSLAALR
jgi:hypothetical protein